MIRSALLRAGVRFLPITQEITYHTLLGASDASGLHVPLAPGSLHVCMTRGRSPWSGMISGLKQRSVSVAWEGYAWVPKELDRVLYLRRRGAVERLSLLHDDKRWEAVAEGTQEAVASVAEVTPVATHIKACVVRWLGGQAWWLSSSNDGADPQCDWYVTGRDMETAAWLAGADGWQKEWKEEVSGILQCSSDLPSGDVLQRVLSASGKGSKLLLLSQTTSAGFCKTLRRWLDDGTVAEGHLCYGFDESVLARLSGSRENEEGKPKRGQTDIKPYLDALGEGVVRFTALRSHAKAAVVVNADGTDAWSILSSANWQATNPRCECYVILRGLDAARWLGEAIYTVIDGLDDGKGDASADVETMEMDLPEIEAEPDGYSEQVLRALGGVRESRRALQQVLRLAQQRLAQVVAAGDPFAAAAISAEITRYAAALTSASSAELTHLVSDAIRKLLTVNQGAELDRELASLTEQMLGSVDG